MCTVLTIMDDAKEKFRQEIADFCAKHNMSPSGFGRWALKNQNFVSDLEKPSYDPKLGTLQKVRLKMKNYKPKKDRHDQ